MKWFKFVGVFLLFIGAGYFGMIWMAPEEVSVQVNEDINAPISQVFVAATDYQTFPKWINGVQAAKQLAGDGAEVGSEYELNYKGEGKMVMNHKVTALEANSLYAYVGTVVDFMQVNSSTAFESLDSTHTRVKTTLTLKPLSNRMKMFMYADETHKKNAASNLTELKEFIEK